MYQSALNEFVPISEPLEGRCTFLYKDNRGFVTTGMGILCDIDGQITPECLSWEWINPDGSDSTEQQIRDCWNLVKSDTSYNVMNGGTQYKNLPGNTIRLTEDAYNKIIQAKLASNIVELRKSFPSIDMWNADGELSTLMMSWGLGAGFSRNYPAFTKAVNSMIPDFVTAAAQSTWSNIAPWRDLAQKTLFLLAAYGLKNNLDPSQLLWPGWDRVRALYAQGFKLPEQLAAQITSATPSNGGGSGGGGATQITRNAPPGLFSGSLGKLALFGALGFGAMKVYQHRGAILKPFLPLPVDTTKTAEVVATKEAKPSAPLPPATSVAAKYAEALTSHKEST